MSTQDKIQLYKDSKIRTHWDGDAEKWLISIIDVIAVLTESIDPAAYWRKLKQRLKAEGESNRDKLSRFENACSRWQDA